MLAAISAGLFAAPHALAETTIAAVPGKAGDHQIPQATQTGKCFRVRSVRNSEPPKLDGRARYQRCFRIVAKPEPITDACRHRENIFHGPAQFDAEKVGARIHAECRAVEKLLYFLGRRSVTTGGDQRGGNVRGHLDGKAWPGQRGALCLWRRLGEDAAHGEACVVFDAFGDTGDEFRNIRRDDG